jgi:hypothetical protein
MLRKFVILSVVGALALLVCVGSVQADATPTPDPDHMHMEGTPESEQPGDEAAHDHGARIPANGASVQIVSPRDGVVLNNLAVIVRVETVNWPLGEDERHWHLLVNGKEQGMSQGNAPALQAHDLQPGENILEAVLSNKLHQELDATHKIIVRYEPASSDAPTAAPAIPTGVVIVLVGIVVAVAAILGIGFAVTRKKTE